MAFALTGMTTTWTAWFTATMKMRIWITLFTYCVMSYNK
jgi:hypothetical protein